MGKKKRVLVVEDESLMGEVLCDLLAETGLATAGPAVDVDGALQLLDSATIDAAMLELRVAGESAFPVAHALSKRRIPFMFLTAYSRDKVPADLVDVPLIEKPFDPHVLRETLKTLLRSRRPAGRPPRAVSDGR